MTERIATYKGRPVTELTREDLIVAYTEICRELQRFRSQVASAYALDRELEELADALTSVRRRA